MIAETNGVQFCVETLSRRDDMWYGEVLILDASCTAQIFWRGKING